MNVNLLNGESKIEVDGVSFEVLTQRLPGKRVMVTETAQGIRVDVLTESSIRAAENMAKGFPRPSKSIVILPDTVIESQG